MKDKTYNNEFNIKYMVGAEEILWYKQILPDCQIVFDVGCRDDSPFEALKSGLDLHLFDIKDYSKNYGYGQFNQIGLSNETGTAFYNPAYESIIERCPSEHPPRAALWKNTPSYEVAITTLKKYCDDKGVTNIDLLKIDTEGNDYNVLLGAGPLIKTIKYIQWEEWDSFAGYGNTMHEDVIKLLTHHKFELKPIGGAPCNWIAFK